MALDHLIKLSVGGLGIIFYSPHSVAHIKEHDDYFHSHYNDGDRILKHILDGSIVGFCTSTSGDFILRLAEGYPTQDVLDQYEFRLRLCIDVQSKSIVFRDVYDLMDWNSNVLVEQCIVTENGYYEVTVCSNCPPSGILGDHQEIRMYFNRSKVKPKLRYYGLPILCE